MSKNKDQGQLLVEDPKTWDAIAVVDLYPARCRDCGVPVITFCEVFYEHCIEVAFHPERWIIRSKP